MGPTMKEGKTMSREYKMAHPLDSPIELAATIALAITWDQRDRVQPHVTLRLIDEIVCGVLNGKPIPEALRTNDVRSPRTYNDFGKQVR